MGPESSWVKVKDLAQEGLILMTIFEAELFTITTAVPPSSQYPLDRKYAPAAGWLLGFLGYGIRFARWRTVPSTALTIGPEPM